MRLYNLKTNKSKRRHLRKNMTKAEIILWSELRRKQFQHKFRRQFGIGPYIVDFYCPKLKLVIELDGDVHYMGDAPQRDKTRTEFLRTKGITVKRYTNSEVIYDLPMVLEDIWNTCDQISKRNLKSKVNLPLTSRGRLERGLKR